MALSPLEQARALEHSAGVRVRDELVLVDVLGDDRLSWLNGQVTADVRAARPGQAVYALAVSVRGKIIADLWVLDRGERLAVLLPAAAREQVLQSFEHQIIMEDVELRPDESARVISVQGPRAGEVVAGRTPEAHRCDELGAGGFMLLCAQAELAERFSELVAAAQALGGGAVDEAGFELARLRAGRGRFGADFGAQHYPQEAGLKALAVSFSKGCYLGQEVVCTLENRGRLTRRLVRMRAPAGAEAQAGAELHDAEGHAVGVLTSVAHDPEHGGVLALGYVKQALATPERELRAGACMLRVIGVAGEP